MVFFRVCAKDDIKVVTRGCKFFECYSLPDELLGNCVTGCRLTHHRLFLTQVVKVEKGYASVPKS